MTLKEIKNRIKGAYYAMAGRPVTLEDERLLEFLGISKNTPRRAMSEAVYFTCQKNLSETIAKLPLKQYQHTNRGIVRPPMTNTLRLLSLQPNPYMNAYTFWGLSEYLCQEYGNSFAYIDGRFVRAGKYGGSYDIEGFYPMHPGSVSILIDDAGIFGTTGNLYYQYTNEHTGEMHVFRSSEVLHFKTWLTKDGITGIPVRSMLSGLIESSNAAAEYEGNLYKNGLSAAMVMQYSSSLEDAKVRTIQKKFADRLTKPENAGKIIPIPAEFQLTPLNMKLTDADFYNLRKYTATQIGAAFGIPPTYLNMYENSKYASCEFEALDFLVKTIQPRLCMYEQELNAKLLTPSEYRAGIYYKFNEKALLRTDSKTQAEVLRTYVQGGIYTANEARELLDKEYKEGGDQLLVNGSYVPISQAGAAYEKTKKGGEKE